jgi:hypothetical protein
MSGPMITRPDWKTGIRLSGSLATLAGPVTA